MDSKAINIDSRIFVPLVNVANIFDLTNGNTEDGERNEIEWNSKSKTFAIYVK
ncbi:MAG: hypothetical protein E6084_00490 [Peptoniphilus harei]|nr:hypothetical protein [Peptoniphilus harei]MDU3010075.1 hypothetical protein [Peptoniphilus harei]MDU5466332.1 hypothetical protein [Peptoniphilus harei]MDU5570278.1 hypothetical protein [Peptoniphilus harei]MDU7114807.1 hypothetical protein [Peptoniphilus harei]